MKDRTSRARAVAVAICLTGVLAGCGGGDGAGGRTPTADDGGVRARGGQALVDAQAAMARCLRRQGIDFPDPRPGGGGFEFDPGTRGIDERRLRAAEHRCARYQRAIAEAAPQPSAREEQRARDLTLRFARCMRAHGARVPDPRAGGEGSRTAVEVPPDAKTDPTFRRAMRRCQGVVRG